jgi:uncharacterized protein YbjT (DUF2867 family)
MTQPASPVLVTGATGHTGRALVETAEAARAGPAPAPGPA